jgi:hypothetical protein
MSYHATGVTDEQEKILLDVPPEALTELSAKDRLTLALEKRRIEAAERAAFWDSVASVVTVMFPIMAAIGITTWAVGSKGKKK